MNVTRLISSTALLAALFVLVAHMTAAAQQRSATERQEAENVRGFRGTAVMLNTTPEALQDAFARARQANPRLNRGQFIAANVVATNLGANHPNVTTQAILSGLQSGKSVGQTLQCLGLSASEAKRATKAAAREVKEGDKRVEEADKRARAESRSRARSR